MVVDKAEKKSIENSAIIIMRLKQKNAAVGTTSMQVGRSYLSCNVIICKQSLFFGFVRRAKMFLRHELQRNAGTGQVLGVLRSCRNEKHITSRCGD